MIAVVVIVCIAMTHVTLTAIAEVERGIEIILQRGTYGRPFFSEKLHDQYLDMFEHISVGVSQRVGEPWANKGSWRKNTWYLLSVSLTD